MKHQNLAKELTKDHRLFKEYEDELARRRLSVFTNSVLGFENADHHREWYAILENRLMQTGSWDDKLTPAPKGHYNRLIGLLAPRSHAKSTCFTVNYALWRIGRDPNIRILIVGANGGISASFLREIKGHIERNTNFHRVFDNLSPENLKDAEKWSTSEIIVKRTNTRLKDPTVSVASAAGTVVSKRADIIICDDMLDENNTRTAGQREKIRDWFNEVLLPVLEPTGQLIVVGTAWNMEDLYHDIMKQPIYDIKKRYKAILNDETQEVLWPERWSYESLMERKQQTGSVAFNKSYQNEAIAAEDAVFQREWLDQAKAKGINRTFLTHMDYAKWDMGKMTIVIGVDLAISQKDDSDFTAMVVLGRNPDGMKIPLFMLRDKLSPKQTRDWIVNLNERFNPDLIMVESNGYQKAIQIDLAEHTDLPIRAYSTGKEKYDIDIGLNSIAVEMENAKWILPYSDTDLNGRRLIDIFVDGCLNFPSGHTEDLLMATWFANAGLRSLTANAQGQQQGSFSKLINR
jgi:hypothetical protein